VRKGKLPQRVEKEELQGEEAIGPWGEVTDQEERTSEATELACLTGVGGEEISQEVPWQQDRGTTIRLLGNLRENRKKNKEDLDLPAEAVRVQAVHEVQDKANHASPANPVINLSSIVGNLKLTFGMTWGIST
jgi:hypothetical protein